MFGAPFYSIKVELKKSKHLSGYSDTPLTVALLAFPILIKSVTISRYLYVTVSGEVKTLSMVKGLFFYE